MPNVKQLIDGHNKAILNNNGIAQPRQDEEKKCNCRKKEECPLNGECLVNEVVYQATVKTKDTKETYIGLTANEFKARYRNHQMSFRHEKRKNETELSKYLWKLNFLVLPWLCYSVVIQYGFVVAIYQLLDIGHAAIAEF